MEHLKNSRRSFIRKAALGSFAAISIPEIISASVPKKAKNKKLVLKKDSVILFQGDSITDAGRNRDDSSFNTPRALGTGYAMLAAVKMLEEFAELNLKIYNKGISGNKVYQLAAIQFPSAKAGCGGIDVFGGSFSHISAAEFKNMLRNITAALPGIAFQLALESVSPLLGGLTKWAKGLETWINNARINSCETAKAIVSTAAEAAGYSSQEACADLAIETGLESDRDAARRRCA